MKIKRGVVREVLLPFIQIQQQSQIKSLRQKLPRERNKSELLENYFVDRDRYICFDRTLSKIRITVRKTINCFITTFCIENDHDFDLFETYLELQVMHREEQ